MARRSAETGGMDAMMRLLAEHPEERRLTGSCALPMKPDGSCLFLEGGLCAYRIRHGDETLPVSCRKFPHLGLLSPRRRLVGLSFACPTALALLAERTALELDEDYRGELPLETLCDFRGEQGSGQAEAESDGEGASAASAFWEAHWSWLGTFRELGGSPTERVCALAERVSRTRLPRIEVDPRLWAERRFDPDQGAALLEAGADRTVLSALYDDWASRIEPSDLPPDPPSDELLNGYLDRRLLVPEFLITGASLGRLLGVLLALVARYRIERARGTGALHAIGHLDRLVLHSDFVPRLFTAELPEPVAWNTLALAAAAAS